MSRNIIKINRGDSFEFSFRIPDKTNPDKNYMLTDEDAVFFALVQPHQRFEDAIFIKGYDHSDLPKISKNGVPTGEILVELLPSDTRYLAPGIYYYTVKLQRGGTLEAATACDDAKEIRTIIERTKFIINE